MPVDPLSGDFVVKGRESARDDYLRDRRFRTPGLDTSPDTDVFVEASTFADGVAPMYFNAKKAAKNTSIFSAEGAELDKEGNAYGIPRQGEGASVGYLVIDASAAGGSILAGAQLRYAAKNQRFKVLFTDSYNDGDLLAIQSLDGGPQTNLPAGSKLDFINPVPGIAPSLVVFENTDGTGLIGGANAENDEEYRARLFANLANPASSANAANVIRALEKIRGIAVAKGFCYPAILGPGTMGVAFIMRTAIPGGTRLPTSLQIALVEQALRDTFPEGDGIIVASGMEDGVDLRMQVTWLTAAHGWVDLVPWPEHVAVPVTVSNAAPRTVSSCRVTTSSTVSTPVVGQSIALFDTSAQPPVFRKKRIASVAVISAGHTFDLTFDLSTPEASDGSYVPVVDAIVSPYAVAINDLVTPVLGYFDKQGPGEQVATFIDPGTRQRRTPAPMPTSWPNKIENRIVEDLFVVVEDVEVLDIPRPTAVGTPGVLFYVHRLTDLGVAEQ